MDKNSSARNGTIDILRFVGLSLIILAHVSPPDLLFNLRCFDVPMMLFVSGLAYSNHRIDFSASFLVRRTLRLIVPVYVFLTAYFLLTAGLKYFAGIDFGIAARHIVGSYLLMDGIGFVWVIRIFLLIALLTPVLMRFERAVHSDVALCLMLAGVSALLTAAIRMRWGMNIAILRDFVYYAVGYSVPFVAGLRVLPMKGRRLKRFFLFTVVAVLLCGIEIGGVNMHFP